MLMLRTADGSRIALHDLGGEGEPILLVHATGFHGRVFEELACHLVGFHAYAVDLRGHGVSVAAESWTGDWSGFAEDVMTAAMALGVDKPVAFGHSCGGAALLLAEEASPGLFGRLYCFEPVVEPLLEPRPPTLENPLSSTTLRRRTHFRSKKEAVANYASKPPLNSLTPGTLRAYVEHGFEELPDGCVRLRCRPEVEAEVYAHGMAHNAFAGLPAVACPVRLACGAGGEPFGEAVMSQLAERLNASGGGGGRGGGASVRVFPRLGHFGPLEDPASVAEDVIRCGA